MDITIQPATPAEQLYAYSQSQQIAGQTGCIGHLRADHGSGKEFFSTWNDRRTDLKSQEFKDEFDAVINALRSDKSLGHPLKDRTTLSKFCHAHPESVIPGSNGREFCFRADTANYAYIIRLNPSPSEYNCYCYCHKKDWFDHHLKAAEKGIRIIDSHYKELFRLEDGDSLRVISPNGRQTDSTARFIDDYHMELGGISSSLYHICEFAERMEAMHNTVIPLRKSLPEQCYTNLLETSDIVLLKKGETGCYKTELCAVSKEEAEAIVNEMNAKLGVTPPQREAMKAGSMFGFHVPAADPKNYDTLGNPMKNQKRNRSPER